LESDYYPFIQLWRQIGRDTTYGLFLMGSGIIDEGKFKDIGALS